MLNVDTAKSFRDRTLSAIFELTVGKGISQKAKALKTFSFRLFVHNTLSTFQIISTIRLSGSVMNLVLCAKLGVFNSMCLCYLELSVFSAFANAMELPLIMNRLRMRQTLNGEYFKSITPSSRTLPPIQRPKDSRKKIKFKHQLGVQTNERRNGSHDNNPVRLPGRVPVQTQVIRHKVLTDKLLLHGKGSETFVPDRDYYSLTETARRKRGTHYARAQLKQEAYQDIIIASNNVR